MKKDKFDYVDVETAVRIINKRLNSIGKKVSNTFQNQLEYELKDFFESEEDLIGGTIELDLRNSDLIVYKKKFDGKEGQHSYALVNI